MNDTPNLYVCGDSFCYSDPDHSPSWVELLTGKIPQCNVINLSSPGASNYLISLQVQYALKHSCDYLIYQATSSTRTEFSLHHELDQIDNINRYWAPYDQNNKSVVSNSWHSATRGTDKLLQPKDTLIKKYFSDCVDFPSMIMKNYIYIDYTLRLIKDSLPKHKWAWSRGGFEHTRFNTSTHFKFSKSSNHWDFSKYEYNQCPINLWDEFDPALLRPYHHIVDLNLKHKTSDWYIEFLKLKLLT